MPSIIIIGGGPAGSMTAILLARRRWQVTLVEQHRFPREKVCGECLSALGIDVLRRHGLDASVETHHPLQLTRTVFHAPSGESVSADLPLPMWGISRATLDDAMLDEARRAGVAILQPARCEAIAPSVLVRDLVTNIVRPLTSDFVVLADGKCALASNRPPPTSDLGIRAHFTDVDAPRDAIGLFGVDGHYGGVAPIEGGLFNVAFSIPSARVGAANGDLDAIFANMLGENASLHAQFHRATRVGDWLASPLPRFGVVDAWPTNVVPVGNAAAALEPIGGEGMGLAMRSAELAANALHRSVATGTAFDWPRLKRQYDQLWRVRRFVCRAGAKIIASPRLASWSVGFMHASPVLADAMFRACQKS